MTLRISRIGRLTGAAVLAVLAPSLAHAQQGTPTPAPAPRSTPNIITLPGADQFQLRPSGAQPTTRPTVQPTVRPTPTPTAAATSAARATPAPRPAVTSRAVPQVAQPTVAPPPAAQPTPEATPVVEASPTPAAALTSTPTPVPVAAAQGGVPWFWILIGAAMASVLVLLGWLLGRRRQPAPIEEPEPVVAAPPPRVPAPPPRAPAPPPPVAPRPAPRPALPAEPVAVELRPIAIALSDGGAVIDFELIVGNASTAGVEGLRVAYGLMSASQIQDELIAGFHMTQLPPVAEPFSLAPREGMRIPGQLSLAPDKINIVDVGGRPMFVPILLIDLRWRSGLSVKHQSCDFMVGMGGQGDKLGPIWLDKGAQRLERLNANRYFPKPVAAAAE